MRDNAKTAVIIMWNANKNDIPERIRLSPVAKYDENHAMSPI